MVLTTNVALTYNQPVCVLAGFVGAVLTPGGSAGVLDSASFGIAAPRGAIITTLSSVVCAAAVPEPAVPLLFTCGLAALWSSRRRA